MDHESTRFAAVQDSRSREAARKTQNPEARTGTHEPNGSAQMSHDTLGISPVDLSAWLAGFPPAAPAVAVPVFNAFEDVLECVESLLANTPAGTPILVVDDASTDPRIPEALEPLSRAKGFAYVRLPENCGFVKTVNLALTWCAPHDVVVANSDVVVPPGWLERLQAAANVRSTVATATPLTNAGTLLSVPYRNQPVLHLEQKLTTAEVDARIREASLGLRPIIPTAIGHCTYFKRTALDVVGDLDEAFSPGYGEEVDFSQRAVSLGFTHVAADDLFVFHKGERSFGARGKEETTRLHLAHEQILAERYPWYHPWVKRAESEQRSPLALALETARGALLGYRVAVDATRVDGTMTGTQLGTLELFRALATAPRRAHLTLIVADRATKEMLMGVDELASEVVRPSELQRREMPAFDLVHRPSQVRFDDDLRFLHTIARRCVVSHLDCIAYANPSYAESPEQWSAYRRVTQATFATVDGIAFNSNDVAADAGQHGLVIPPERAYVAYNGVDHLWSRAEGHLVNSLERLSHVQQPFLLMLGTNFRHKNRVFGIRLLAALQAQYGWPGSLVFAGPRVSSGSSAEDEAKELASDRAVQSRVIDLGMVDEADKLWLLEHAALLLYPSIYEGFGLVPFEAAAAGTPALTMRCTSLPEVLGEEVRYLESFDPQAGADVVWSLVSNPELARKQVEALNRRAADFTWRNTAERTWQFYERLLKMAPRLGEWAPDTLPLDMQQVGEPPARSWPQRVARAIQILRTEGTGALLLESRQFIWWLQAQRAKAAGPSAAERSQVVPDPEARQAVVHYCPEEIDGIEGYVSCDQAHPKGKTSIHTAGLGDLSGIPVAWPVGDLTGLYPSGNVADSQRGINPEAYGSSAVQLQGHAAGLHVASHPAGSTNVYKLAQLLYAWGEPVFPWKYGQHARLCITHDATVSRSSVANGAISYAYATLALTDVSSDALVWIALDHYDSRGLPQFHEMPIWWPEAALPIFLGYFGRDTHYSTLLPGSSTSTDRSWKEWRTFGVSISRAQLRDIATTLNGRFDLHLSTNPDFYRLELVGVGPELYITGQAQGSISMRVRSLKVFTWLERS